MRVLLDTNILVSMIFFPSSITKAFSQVLTKHQVVICDYVIEELVLVVERKFSSRKRIMDDGLLQIPFDLIYTPKHYDDINIPSIRDEKDSPILAAALIENVDVFVTGDKDFLAVEKVEGLDVLTMADFIKRFK